MSEGDVVGKDGRSERTPRSEVLAVTRDGVALLKAPRATHFTEPQIRKSIKKVIAARQAG